VKTAKFEASFLEVPSVSLAFSAAIAQPRSLRAALTVEAVIKGKAFDDCINAFIKRVVEEAFEAEQNKDILTVSFKAVMGRGSAHVIDVKTIRSKRVQVLSLLKSAVMDDGEVYVEMYVRYSSVLPPLGPSSALYSEETAGFVHVVRR
jgi:hypothetical protein